MNDELKKLEGSYNVNGDKTPITHEDISQVDSSQWNTLPTHMLLDHHATLKNRLYTVSSMPNGASMSKQIQMGIARLETILATRKDNNITLI